CIKNAFAIGLIDNFQTDVVPGMGVMTMWRIGWGFTQKRYWTKTRLFKGRNSKGLAIRLNRIACHAAIM
ncbi:hypothetical protein ABTM89_19755, partial [Acinetobacter baumannii]